MPKITAKHDPKWSVSSCRRGSIALLSQLITALLLLQLHELLLRPCQRPRSRASARPTYYEPLGQACDFTCSPDKKSNRDNVGLLILIIGFCFPMVSVVIDGLTYGDAVTISPPEYWALFGNFVPGMGGA